MCRCDWTHGPGGERWDVGPLGTMLDLGKSDVW